VDVIGTIAKLVASLIPGGSAYEPVRIIANFLVYASIVLHFIKLTESSLKELNSVASEAGLQVPRDESERHSFVILLHEILQRHPYLQPTEKSGKALL
jgi:hypothetical protein